MMKASYHQINHLSWMLKPGGKEGDVSLKSKAGDDARSCNSQTKSLLMLRLTC